MNRHAEKLDVTEIPKPEDISGQDWGGILRDFHSCPRCGDTVVRRADARADIGKNATGASRDRDGLNA